MQLWHVWIIAAVIFFVAEIFVPGFFLACLGVGCVASALVSTIISAEWFQLLVFSISTLAAFFTIRPMVFRYLYGRSRDVKTNVDALPGRKARVVETINPLEGTGRVKIEGEEWKAVSVDEAEIEKGEQVVVEKVEGAKVYIRKI